jgi:hypothetical protein
MRLPINPWAFLGRLLVFFALTYLAWMPSAPTYTSLLLWASRAGIALTEIGSEGNTALRTGSPCLGPPVGGASRGCGQYCGSDAECPSGVACVAGICQLFCEEKADCTARCGASAVCHQVPNTAIFYNRPEFARLGIAPQGIPAEWVMANLVLLIPLMLATPAPTWRARFVRLGVALAAALVLQVADVIVGIKAFYAQAFHWSPWKARLYQFLDAFFQSWDTQLFPFAIWAGVHFRQLVGSRISPGEPPTPEPAAQATPRAERRRGKQRRRRG